MKYGNEKTSGPKRSYLEQSCLNLLIVVMWMACAAGVAAGPDSSSTIDEKTFRHRDLDFLTRSTPIDALPLDVAERAKQQLEALGVEPENGYVDLRSGKYRWSTLVVTEPVIPGSGFRNFRKWAEWNLPGPPDQQVLEQIAWRAVVEYLEAHEAELRIDVAELEYPAQVDVLDGGDRIRIFNRRDVDGVPVARSYMSANIVKGNLIMLGFSKWGDVDPGLVSRQALTGEQAEAKVAGYLADVGDVTSFWREPELTIVPTVAGGGEAKIEQPYSYGLFWKVSPRIPGDSGSYQVLMDATNAAVFAVSNVDKFERQVEGGVFPLTNDPAVVGGTEITYPMPLVDLSDGLTTIFTDHGGFTPSFPLPGGVATMLNGGLVGIVDQCAVAAGTVISVGSSDEVVDLGSSPGTNCIFPTGTSEGNTHAARTSYYHLNRMQETAAGQLPPATTFLANQVMANTNRPAACDARWNTALQRIELHQSDPTALDPCSNGGEIASRIIHEWGHGLDENDFNMVASSPGEGIADVYAALRVNDSCIARGWFLGTPCGGYGSPCLSCDGSREIDFAQYASGVPHTPQWTTLNCPAATGGAIPGPCLGSPHCEGLVTSESIWDLLKRDLPAVHGYDFNTALEVTTRLTYEAAGMVDEWFECSWPTAGCLPGSGFIQFLMADDDNGTLFDGTPHMDAIFSAFDRHGAACQLMTMATPQCVGGPTTAPALSAVAHDQEVELFWTAVPGASTYQVFRTEGIFGCDIGKILVDEVSGTTLTDTGLKNGREYSYIVIPVGAAAECTGLASTCEAATPVPSSCGDCNADGRLDVIDALAAASHSAGLDLLSGGNLINCDVDGSGNVNVVDALIIAQTASGLPTTLQCPVCRDCDRNGVPGEMSDFALLQSMVTTDVMTSNQAVCDVNGDRRIDAADVADFYAGPPGCVSCGDSNTDGRVDAGDIPLLPAPFPYLPGTRHHAASDVVFPERTVDQDDEMEIADYIAGTIPDLACYDLQAVSPRPRLHSYMGSYCISGASNGTPFDITVTGPAASATYPGVSAPGLPCDADCLVGQWFGLFQAPFAALPSAVGGACFDVIELPAAAVTLTVDSCNPVSTPAGCPFG